MLTHLVQPSTKPGYLRVVDSRSGLGEDVFVGVDIAARVHSETAVRPTEEAPSQKWCSHVAA